MEFPGGYRVSRIEAVQFVKWRQYWFGLRALEAIIIQINKGKEYGLKSKRVGKNLGFSLSGLYWWLRCKAIRSRVEKRGKLAICIQGRLPHLQEVFLFFPSRLFRTSPPMFFFFEENIRWLPPTYFIFFFFRPVMETTKMLTKGTSMLWHFKSSRRCSPICLTGLVNSERFSAKLYRGRSWAILVYSLQFLPATPFCPFRTLEGLFELTP